MHLLLQCAHNRHINVKPESELSRHINSDSKLSQTVLANEYCFFFLTRLDTIVSFSIRFVTVFTLFMVLLVFLCSVLYLFICFLYISACLLSLHFTLTTFVVRENEWTNLYFHLLDATRERIHNRFERMLNRNWICKSISLDSRSPIGARSRCRCTQ